MTDAIVVGGGITGLATAYRLVEAALSVRLFEAEARVGGTIGTRRRGGYEVEIGPNGVLDSRQEAMAFFGELGLSGALRPAHEQAKKRFLVHRGRLEAIPMSPPSLVRTPLLSWGARLRALTEPFRRSRPDPDESVDAFARRRLGPQVAERFIDPLVSGVFGGDSSQLNLAAAFPKLYDLEARGGLLRGMLSKRREAKRARSEGGGPPARKARAYGRLTAFEGGMQTLTDTLAEKLGDVVARERRAVRLERANGGWAVEVEGTGGGRESFEARQVVLALPSYAAAALVEPLGDELGRALREIPYASLTVVSLGFKESDVGRRLDGFGFLAPSGERREILGSLWTSSIFPGTAPPEEVLLRNMVGGWRQPELAALPDDELQRRVCAELDALIGLRSEPVFVDFARWPRGIPQYHAGHLQRLESIDGLLRRLPGLHLTGNAYRGISINDCIVDADRTAERVREQAR
jgi:protoporphyrinogen/coproporphyrinogen III oxidase